MLSQQEAATKAERIVSDLGAVPARDALEVLQLAMSEVLKQAGRTPELGRTLDCSVAFRPPRGGGSIIAMDDELRVYIHTFTARHTVKQIAEACELKFGADRAPSKSSIDRYLRSLKYRGRARR